MFDRKILMLSTAFATLAATPLMAQQPTPPAATAAPAAAPSLTPGATVYDAQGGTVGTIETADATGAVVSTGANKVKVASQSFAAGPKGPTIAMTKAELDAAAGAAAAKPVDLAVGATVSGPQGAPVGKIEAVEGDLVTVATANTKAKLPKSAFAAGQTGPVIGMTAEQLDAAAGAASASTTPSTGTNPS